MACVYAVDIHEIIKMPSAQNERNQREYFLTTFSVVLIQNEK